MADMSAEDEFLKSLQADTDGAPPNGHSYQQHNTAEEDEEDYDPSSLMPETSYTANGSNPETNASTASGSMAQSPVRTASRASDKPTDDNAPAKQPRTIGGFVVDDEDEEDEGPAAQPKAAGSEGLLNVARGTSNTPQRSLTQTPDNHLSQPDVSIHRAAQDQGASGPSPSGVTESVSVPQIASAPSNTATPVHDEGSAKPSQKSSEPSQLPTGTSNGPQAGSTVPFKGRLPHDRIGMLEDRIAEDPRGDLEAWLSLIDEHRRRGKWDDARASYNRFFKVFPHAAEKWVEYANMELQNDQKSAAENVFGMSLPNVPNVQLWSAYLDYVRRMNNLASDPNGDARRTVNAAYDFVLDTIGVDKDSGQIWQDYVQFIRSGPGIIGGAGWQDQQKMDILRKAYQRAISVPTQTVQALWKQYDTFEMGLNKVTGRKFLQEKSPAYMTARSSYTALDNLTRNLKRTTLPRLPPAPGFEGDNEYMEQVKMWKDWINWEKDDPLVLKDDEPAEYKKRVKYVFKQATMALRFWPEIWYDAAEFCYQHDMEKDGDDFLEQGIAANPESCLLAFKKADRVESTTTSEEGEDALKKRGEEIRAPYDKVLDALYELVSKTKKREANAIDRIKESFAQMPDESPSRSNEEDEEEDQAEEGARSSKEKAMQAQIEAIQKGNDVQIQLLSKTISHVWIALMRAMRRVQGKGKVGGKIGGFRQVFTDARKRGRLTSDVYVTSALIEYHCYKDPAATRIFERGMRLFPDDEVFALEYLKHLIAINDITNARAVFETTVSKLAQKPETLPKAKPIYAFFHEYESNYGELSQISKLEKRMAETFPEDPQLSRFSHRFSSARFDPTTVRPIISPAAQARPKTLAQAPMPTVEPQVQSVHNSPRPLPAQVANISNSPKRPFAPDDSDNEQPRKFARAESPLKGAAGRRIDNQRRNQPSSNLSISHTPAPTPLPGNINFLLSIIPRAESYNATAFIPERMTELMRSIDLSRANVNVQRPMQPTIPPGYGQFGGGYPYPR